MKLEPKAQDIFDRIKPFAPETAYEKGLISAEQGLFHQSSGREKMGAEQQSTRSVGCVYGDKTVPIHTS